MRWGHTHGLLAALPTADRVTSATAQRSHSALFLRILYVVSSFTHNRQCKILAVRPLRTTYEIQTVITYGKHEINM
jgi:hypothetical protein